MKVRLSPQNLDEYLTVPDGKKRIEIVDLSGPPGGDLRTAFIQRAFFGWTRSHRRRSGGAGTGDLRFRLCGLHGHRPRLWVAPRQWPLR